MIVIITEWVQVSLRGDENVLELEAVVAQHHVLKNTESYSFKW